MPGLTLIFPILSTSCAPSDVTISPVDTSQTADTGFTAGGFEFSAEGLCDETLSVDVADICPTVLWPEGEIPEADADGDGLDDACEAYLAAAGKDLVGFIVRTAGVEVLDGCPPLTYHVEATSELSDDAQTITREARLWMNFTDAVGEIDESDYKDCQSQLPQEALCIDLSSTQPADELDPTGAIDDESARAYAFSVIAVGPDGPDAGVSLSYAAERHEAIDAAETMESFLTVGANDYTNDDVHAVDTAVLSGASMVHDTLGMLADICDLDWQSNDLPVCEDSLK